MDTLQKRLTVYIDSTGSTQVSVAKAIGRSPSLINSWLKGKYEGDVTEIDKLVADFLSNAKEQLESMEHGIIETSTYKAIHAYCTLVLQKRSMGMLTGDSGVGKTTALQAYAMKHPAVILIEADPGYTARALFIDLCDALNLDTRGSLHDLFNRVVNKLRGSGRLVIIDEAEQLPYRALELIRRVNDKAKVGIALCGMPRLEKNLKGDPTHYAQLYRRLFIPRRVSGLTDFDIDALIIQEQPKVSKDTLSALRKACGRNARVLSFLLMWCSDIMGRNEMSELTPEIVFRASEMLVAA